METNKYHPAVKLNNQQISNVFRLVIIRYNNRRNQAERRRSVAVKGELEERIYHWMLQDENVGFSWVLDYANKEWCFAPGELPEGRQVWTVVKQPLKS